MNGNLRESGYRMVFFRRIATFVGGLILALLGIPGVSEVVEAWGTWFAVLATILSNPFGYAVTVFFGIALMTVTATEILVERKLAKAGGLTKREFPATLSRWSNVQKFPLREAIWLWHGYEPGSGSFESTRVFPTFRRIEEALNEGVLKGVQPVDGDWLKTQFTRQQLVDLAMHLGEAPAFLIPKRMRSIRPDPNIDDRWFQSIDFVEFSLLDLYKKQNPTVTVTSEQVAAEVRKWLIAGTWESIARERVDDILYPFIRLPPRFWRRATREFYRAKFEGREFESVQIRQVNDNVAR